MYKHLQIHTNLDLHELAKQAATKATAAQDTTLHPDEHALPDHPTPPYGYPSPSGK